MFLIVRRLKRPRDLEAWSKVEYVPDRAVSYFDETALGSSGSRMRFPFGYVRVLRNCVSEVLCPVRLFRPEVSLTMVSRKVSRA